MICKLYFKEAVIYKKKKKKVENRSLSLQRNIDQVVVMKADDRQISFCLPLVK
jgi:hypothetical protein